MMKNIVIFVITLFVSISLLASDAKNEEDIDYMALAAILIKDAHYTRANEALSHVNLEAKDMDLVHYYTLKGIVQMKLGKLEASNAAFYKAIELGQTQESIYLYIAQNSFKLKKYEETITALESAKTLLHKNPKLMALKAESYYRLKKYNEALETLATLLKEHNDYYDAYRQRFAYFVNLKLYQSALSDATMYLQHAKANEQITLSFINALREAKETQKAIVLAEEAHLQYPNNATIILLLANLYIDKDMLKSAAELFNEAANIEYKYTKDAAEMFRRAKDFTQALYKNSQILDTKEKYKQKVAIYLEFGEYEKLVAMHDALERNGLLKIQNILYALAYSYYKVGEFEEAEKYLKGLTDSSLFKKAIELRKNMAKCKNNHWECRV